MSTDEIVCHSADTLEDKGENIPNNIPQELLHSLEPSTLPLSELRMKLGCPLMLLCNLDPGKGLCNRTHMILLQVYHQILEIIIIGGDHHAEKAFIPRILLKPSSRQYPFTLRQCQFPVHLCFAMTINKVEGQSLKYVGIHLILPVFCHSKLYIVLSRATLCKRVLILTLCSHPYCQISWHDQIMSCLPIWRTLPCPIDSS